LCAGRKISICSVNQNHSKREHTADNPGIYVAGEDKCGELAGSLKSCAKENPDEKRTGSGNSKKPTRTMRDGLSHPPQVDRTEQHQQPRNIGSNSVRKQAAHTNGKQGYQDSVADGEKDSVP